MSSRQHEEESLLGRAARMAIMGVASAGVGSAVAHGLDGAIGGPAPVDVTGLSGSHVDTGSTFHHGPTEGGTQLDRPSTGYLADASMSHGVELDRGMDVSTIARDIDKAGSLTVDGQTYSVLDYMPGGDVMQLAAGSVNPSQLMMSLAQHGLQQQMGAEAGSHSAAATGVSGIGAGTPSGQGMQGAGDASLNGNDTTGMSSVEVAQKARAGGATAIAAARAAGHHIPDADENARDLERLALEHRMDLDTAVETSDSAHVHTEIHAHGRTLKIDTDFEATARNNDEERAEAAEHVRETARGSMTEMEHNRPDMHFRSKVQAHLDAAAQDQGMSI